VLGREVQEATEADNIVEDVPELHVDVPKQTYIIPKYPEPFFRGKTGGIFKRMKNKEGDPIEVPIYHNDFYVVRRLRDPDVGEAVVMRLHLPKDGVREFTVPLASILSKDEFRKYMAAHGVAVIKMEELMSYTASWVNKLQATTQADEARRQFGWVDEQMSAFVVGSKEIRADRVDHNPPSSSTVRMFPLFQARAHWMVGKKSLTSTTAPTWSCTSTSLACHLVHRSCSSCRSALHCFTFTAKTPALARPLR
jgi:hypothetical protein